MSGLVRKTWNRDMSRHDSAPARTAARQTVARRGATATPSEVLPWRAPLGSDVSLRPETSRYPTPRETSRRREREHDNRAGEQQHD